MSTQKKIIIILSLTLVASCGQGGIEGNYTANRIQQLSDVDFTTIYLPYQLSFISDKCLNISFSKYSRATGWSEDDTYSVTVDYQEDTHSVCIYDLYTFNRTDTGFSTQILGKEGTVIAIITYERQLTK